jgi:hypothetical protein
MTRNWILLLFVVGCSRERTFKDTEGATFRVTCSGVCRNGDDFTQEGSKAAPSGAPTLPGDKAGFALADAQARYLAVCDAWKRTSDDGSGQSWSGGDCRIVTCSADGDCPPATFMREPKCVNGLCGDPSRPIAYDDVEWLCLAGTGRGGVASDVQKARHDLAILACKEGSGCTVPKECRQP